MMLLTKIKILFLLLTLTCKILGNDIVDSCSSTTIVADNLVFNETVFGGAIPFFAHNYTLLYYGDKVITCINITSTDSSGYTNATIIDGGVGKPFVLFNLTSAFESSIGYDAVIYATGTCTAVTKHDKHPQPLARPPSRVV